ncbi:MAG TPA: hypothetical protein VK993_00490 [Chthoniobacterales bacterium]|nr:hypothetical protein [Chthoniobacterales bacterium]
MTPAGVGIAIVWIVGLFLIGKARSGLPWHAGGGAPGGQEKTRGHAKEQKEKHATAKGHGTSRTLIIFIAGAIVTLARGIAFELRWDAIAKHIGISGVLFGATVLVAATALPEVSTGLASVKLGDYKLAISDIFGGNAFLPVLFRCCLATLFCRKRSGPISISPLLDAADVRMAKKLWPAEM